jgi:UDP-N-acetylglucosamine:LPS N-acetylglucosamine transferase
VARALISFAETARYFPRGKTELTGPAGARGVLRDPAEAARRRLHVLITGGSQGSRTLNRASARKLAAVPRGGVRGAHRAPDGARELEECARPSRNPVWRAR